MDKPFFLVMETEEPDTASHANDVVRLRKSVDTLNMLLNRLESLTKGRDDTLLVFVSDHESGGLVLDEKI